MTDNTAGVSKAREHVLALEPWIRPQQVIDAVPRGQHAEHMLDRQPPTADDLWRRLRALRFALAQWISAA